MDNQTAFEQVWDMLCRKLVSQQEIRNWALASGYIGENFDAQLRKTKIVCTLPSGTEIPVSKTDFEKVYNLWPGYLNREVLRKDIREETFRAKYTISILHQVLEEQYEANTPEPEIKLGKNPEQSLQQALMTEIRSILAQAVSNFILLESFGLDIAVFVEKDGRSFVRMIEVKAFVGNRPGGIGIGNGRGKGSQIDLLIHSSKELKVVDSSIRWVLGVGTLPKGSPRYAIFTSVQAKDAAMGEGVAREKQNNLRVADFENQLITWDELIRMLRKFLLE